MPGAAEIEDAEVVSEGPRVPPPPPRQAELKPAPASDAFGVFDGPVHDAKNAKKPVDEARKKARQAAKDKRGGKKTAAAPSGAPGAAAAAPAPGADELARKMRARQKAVQLLKLYEMWQLGQVREAFGPMLTPTNLADLCKRVEFSPLELQAMGEPLAEGLLENGIEFPWWVEFGVAFGAAVFVRHQQLAELEMRIRGQYEAQQQPANDNSERPSTSPAPAPAAAAS